MLFFELLACKMLLINRQIEDRESDDSGKGKRRRKSNMPPPASRKSPVSSVFSYILYLPKRHARWPLSSIGQLRGKCQDSFGLQRSRSKMRQRWLEMTPTTGVGRFNGFWMLVEHVTGTLFPISTMEPETKPRFRWQQMAAEWQCPSIRPSHLRHGLFRKLRWWRLG